LTAITQELGVSFAFNTTEDNNFVTWAPNRQVLRGLNKDLATFVNITLGQPLIKPPTSYTTTHCKQF
jgi:hypothetical protein